eukprot:4262589-Lingulodinium_polyedra.AAC.1
MVHDFLRRFGVCVPQPMVGHHQSPVCAWKGSPSGSHRIDFVAVPFHLKGGHCGQRHGRSAHHPVFRGSCVAVVA